MFRPSRVVDTRSSNAHPHSADAQCSPMIPASSSIGIFARSHAAPTAIELEREFVPPLVASRPFDQPFDALRARHRFRLTPFLTTPTDILLGDRPARFALHVSHLRAKE